MAESTPVRHQTLWSPPTPTPGKSPSKHDPEFAFLYAAKTGNRAEVHRLLLHDPVSQFPFEPYVHVDATTQNGSTALLLACGYDNVDVVDLLCSFDESYI